MHIPDGYLSFQTSLPVLGAMVPVWSLASNKLKKTINRKQVPLISLCAAFSFVIMMLNIPLGPSSVHAVGAVFIAILMGPWAACVAVSVALIIQAFVFGDGGVWAIGANCFNMAFTMTFAGYYVYKIISVNRPLVSSGVKTLSRRSVAGIFAGGYVGINLAALLTAVEFGIQPLLFKTAGGIPQYGFYPLSVSVPAMMFEHLLVAGPIEGFITVSAVAYLVKFAPRLFAARQENRPEDKSFISSYKSFIIGLVILVIITPLGLFATGTAWGEWGTDEIKEMLGYVPAGLDKLSQSWNAMLPDYSVPGLDKGMFQSSAGYILSAVVGILLILAVTLISRRFIAKEESDSDSVE